jgi:hypothetical protein
VCSAPTGSAGVPPAADAVRSRQGDRFAVGTITFSFISVTSCLRVSGAAPKWRTENGARSCMIKPIKDTPVRTHRKFDETFKREAVANWLSIGRSATVIGEELGIKSDRLYSGRKPFGPAAAAAGIGPPSWRRPGRRSVSARSPWTAGHGCTIRWALHEDHAPLDSRG